MINLNTNLLISVSMKSKITYRDRAVEAIARALEWVKEEGNSYPYKIAFQNRIGRFANSL